MVYFTNNKKLNIKINILLAAFLEDEFYDIEVCLDEINKSLQENIGICRLVNDNKNTAYNIVEHESLYMRAINEITDSCENFGIDLKANYNRYHATIDCYFHDLI